MTFSVAWRRPGRESYDKRTSVCKTLNCYHNCASPLPELKHGALAQRRASGTKAICGWGYVLITPLQGCEEEWIN